MLREPFQIQRAAREAREAVPLQRGDEDVRGLDAASPRENGHAFVVEGQHGDHKRAFILRGRRLAALPAKDVHGPRSGVDRLGRVWLGRDGQGSVEGREVARRLPVARPSRQDHMRPALAAIDRVG